MELSDKVNRATARHLALLCAEGYQDAPELYDYNRVETVTYGTDDAVLYWRPGLFVIAFRGTELVEQAWPFGALVEWIANLKFRPRLWDTMGVHLHRGFLINFRGLWAKLAMTSTYQRHRDSKVDRVVYAGHSRGGAIAQIAGLYKQPDLVCSFGSPRVGGPSFAERCRHHGLRHWRLVNTCDVVPHLPPGIWFRHYGTKFRASVTGTHEILEYIGALS